MSLKREELFPVTVTGLKVKVAQQFRDECVRKLHSLKRVFKHIESGTVAIRNERGFYIAEITLLVLGLKMRSEEREKSMRAAFDLAFNAIKEQLRRFKEKLYDRYKRSSGAVYAQPADVKPTTPRNPKSGHSVKIKRIKQFESKPMSIDEAALQMELLGHEFFAFINSETERFCVLYRRKDGSYGMIELV